MVEAAPDGDGESKPPKGCGRLNAARDCAGEGGGRTAGNPPGGAPGGGTAARAAAALSEVVEATPAAFKAASSFVSMTDPSWSETRFVTSSMKAADVGSALGSGGGAA
eukprot:SAG11_NODE_3941_length_2139_cov_12.066176_3_plen_108_part_00